MNKNRVIGFIVAAVILAVLIFAALSLFELYPRAGYISPSREARINEYLALDRWLESRGVKTRTETSGDIYLLAGAAEKNIFIQSSLFYWNREAVDYLLRWVEEGGSLFLSLDDVRPYRDFYSGEYRDSGDALALLGEFGVTAETETSDEIYGGDFGSPGYDRKLAFEPFDFSARGAEAGIPVSGEMTLLKDGSGIVRLARVNRGKGKLTVTGRPVFLRSGSIGDAPNARLAWAIFLEDAPESWLFIRGITRTGGLLGSLFKEGNLPVILVSLLVLLVTGFWAAIPRFGLNREDNEKPGKSLRERFLAEGYFLKRYRALDYYRRIYIKEIKRRLAGKEGFVSDEELRRKIPELADILEGRSLVYRDFSKTIITLKTVLELFDNASGETKFSRYRTSPLERI